MALFVSGGVEINGIAFVEFRGSLKAGHATQRRCYPDIVWSDQAAGGARSDSWHAPLF